MSWSSSHCLRKTRESRRDRISARRATAPSLTSVNRDKRCLFEAVNAQDYERVLDLLQSGVDPRTADIHRRTSLHVASTKLDAAIVKALIDHGADVNAEDALGNTPLHLACVSGRLPIVGVLLRAGANVTLTTNDGDRRATPLTFALSRLQSMMNEKCTLSSPTARADIIELIGLLKDRASLENANTPTMTMSNLCNQLENLNTCLSHDVTIDPSLFSNLTISLYEKISL